MARLDRAIAQSVVLLIDGPVEPGQDVVVEGESTFRIAGINTEARRIKVVGTFRGAFPETTHDGCALTRDLPFSQPPNLTHETPARRGSERFLFATARLAST
jgi:hypothetical protein